MLQMTTKEIKATEREKQGVEWNVLALDWVFFHGRPLRDSGNFGKF